MHFTDGAKLVKLEGVGHVPHIEVPDKSHAAVLEFLSGVKQ
jgi:pimeloyl-ACP methyl ester carboxylesterase